MLHRTPRHIRTNTKTRRTIRRTKAVTTKAWYDKNEAKFSQYVKAIDNTTIEDPVSGLKLLETMVNGLKDADRVAFLESVLDHTALDNRLTAADVKVLNGYFGENERLYGEHNKANLNMYTFDRTDRVRQEALGEYLEPLKVSVTGAAGAIGYSLVHRIASGAVFGNRRVQLQLLELPGAMDALNGVVMELEDCTFPTLSGIVATDKADVAFEGCDYAFLVGAKPRGPGEERSDLLLGNAKIFSAQGKSLNKVGKGKDTRVIVVGNPANTNAYIASHFAKKIPRENFVAMTRLDHNRGLAQLSEKLNVPTTDISNFIIWGNHSSTQFPDVSHAVLKDGRNIKDLVDQDWLVKDFIPTVQQRGAAIIKARGSSSAASAASAAADNIRDWHRGTDGAITSAAVSSSGEYGITEGLFFSYPVVYSAGKHTINNTFEMDAFAQERVQKTHTELLEERDAVANILK